MVPHNITFAPLESAINYTIDKPEILYTQVNHQEWLKTNSQPASTPVDSVAQVESNSEDMSQMLQPQSDAVFSIEKCSTNAPGASSTIASSTTTSKMTHLLRNTSNRT